MRAALLRLDVERLLRLRPHQDVVDHLAHVGGDGCVASSLRQKTVPVSGKDMVIICGAIPFWKKDFRNIPERK